MKRLALFSSAIIMVASPATSAETGYAARVEHASPGVYFRSICNQVQENHEVKRHTPLCQGDIAEFPNGQGIVDITIFESGKADQLTPVSPSVLARNGILRLAENGWNMLQNAVQRTPERGDAVSKGDSDKLLIAGANLNELTSGFVVSVSPDDLRLVISSPYKWRALLLTAVGPSETAISSAEGGPDTKEAEVILKNGRSNIGDYVLQIVETFPSGRTAISNINISVKPKPALPNDPELPALTGGELSTSDLFALAITLMEKSPQWRLEAYEILSDLKHSAADDDTKGTADYLINTLISLG